MVAYRIALEPDDNDTLLVTCPDLPGVVTFGETREAALSHAVDAIETWIASLVGDGLDVPAPSRPKRGDPVVSLPALTSLKIELYWALRAAGITRAELKRRLGWNRESVDRLFRIDHASRLDQIEQALKAIGRRVEVSVSDAA